MVVNHFAKILVITGVDRKEWADKFGIELYVRTLMKFHIRQVFSNWMAQHRVTYEIILNSLSNEKV